MAEALAAGVREGNARALARALTVVENDPRAAARLLAKLGSAGGDAHRVGITGPPGVGKSTLLGALAGVWRKAERRVGVLAVDPSSPFSGGALLGDRIRMGALAGDRGVFIRSLASRGASGGLSAAVDDAADVLAAAGFDPVIVETVGVGQAEVEIARAADTTVLVLAPGHGDEIQAMKAGLLEVADLLVVNQSDRPEADDFARDLQNALALRTGPVPPIFRTTARTGEGVEALAAAIDERAGPDRADELAVRRRDRAVRRIRAEVDQMRADAWWATHADPLEEAAAAVIQGDATVAEMAVRLLALEWTEEE